MDLICRKGETKSQQQTIHINSQSRFDLFPTLMGEDQQLTAKRMANTADWFSSHSPDWKMRVQQTGAKMAVLRSTMDILDKWDQPLEGFLPRIVIAYEI